MKKILLLVTSLLLAFFVNAQVSKTVNVETAGTLRTLLTTAEMTTVTNLTVIGSIDARDFKFIRIGITSLAVLDIGEVTIQAYVGTGGTSNTTTYPVNELPEYSFESKVTLTSLIIPKSISSIGDYALANCTGITNLIIPNSVISIGDYAFASCKELTYVAIGDSVTSIGGHAFEKCSKLTNISIPNSVTSIRESTFHYCTGLTSVTIGNSVTSIGGYAFGSCTGLTSLTIPNSVTTINYVAFAWCTGLTSVTMGDSVTSIGGHAFEQCSKLTSISIPKSVISIGEGAFDFCTELTSIYAYATTPVALSSNPFRTLNVYVCTLYVPAGSIGAYQAASYWGDFFNIVEMTPTALPTLASESAKIYPNPVTDSFYIDGLDAVCSLTLTDLGGKTVLTKHIMANEYVNVDFLPKGVYIARITTPKGLIEKKIIKD